MVLTGVVMVLELAGAWASNSLALLSDAGHMLTDLVALGLALFACTMAARPAPARASYGWHRLEILAALANGVLLTLLAGALLWSAWERILAPPAVNASILTVVAAVGLGANLLGVLFLRGARRRGLNVRGAFLHVLSDALSSAAVVVSGALIAATGWYRADPILGFAIGLVIVVGAIRLVRDAVTVLLEATPPGIDLAAVESSIRGLPGVRQVHDLHIWCITSGMTALSGHVVLDGTTLDHSDRTLNSIKTMLRERWAIEHTTIQVESEAYREVGEVH